MPAAKSASWSASGTKIAPGTCSLSSRVTAPSLQITPVTGPPGVSAA